ncbi:chemotaxis protein CheC [Haloplanus aerogenes]|uniref:Chemotaxis protein CheA n=1 Tax=Haloplanus aerogenes TaxID=660522 RepID=A0A3M0DZ74_9EURY|nr:chemotaxis protein CheC [Haloplanus aerogenes]AZH25307.1 chemotaxis protein CheA [Haloplanus aerogenes]RMB25003.1 two-component system chemotaxis sensor kinase CheA/chemotaxis protein CheC [Haloplanus aerogenes]
MRVDIQSLGTYNRLAQEGAEHAAASLTQMTGIETYVDVTNVTLMSKRDVEDVFGGTEFVGIQIGLGGGLSGETALAFDRSSAASIVDVLVPGATAGDDDSFDEMARSGVKEIGNIMMGGFVDGWADYLATSVDMTPPTYVERDGTDVLPNGALERAEEDHVFVFESQMTAVDEQIDAYIYMLPEYGAFSEMLEASDDHEDAIPMDKLTVFDEMTRQGAERAAENVSSMTGIETDVDVSRLSFVPIEDVPNTARDEVYLGTVMEFKGTPGGYLAILFDEPSARTIVDATVPMELDDPLGDMGESAIQEMGNIMTSGFIDGWANVLQTSIDHTPPELVHDLGTAILSPIAGRLGQSQEYAFLMDSTVVTPEGEFNCEIYAIPDEQKLKQALDSLLVERSDQLEANRESLF